MSQQQPLLIVSGDDIVELLDQRETEILEAVAEGYKAHARGHSSLPHSNFLRFPDSDRDRIIALPAYVGEPFELAGIKWIASVPGNIERGMERASATVILNHRDTGRPFAILEGSIISARRTAASAALAARELHRGEAPEVIGLVGCGLINWEICRFLAAVWPQARRFVAYDLSTERAEQFGRRLEAAIPGATLQAAASLEEALGASPVSSFATTAVNPYLENLDACPEGATVLHISLRDLLPEAILAHDNVVDDLDHVCRAGTSIHLAAEATGHRDFVRTTLGEVLLGQAPPAPEDRAIIFSPFGMGVLDLAVSDLVYRRAREEGRGTDVPSFLPTPWTER
ncbi:MAG: 2,3-diaminopropionate biosynthesis protein SbnB [Acidobacteriota bacterium]|nr:2,3-diaminopropionate biosynthesis protein SbnB [Acidobacteriota bacterium]